MNNTTTEKNMTDKNVNYTENQTAEIIAMYEAKESDNKTIVASIAEKFGKTTRSIIAKLSREGVYETESRVTKTGEPVITKAELVAQIVSKLGLDGTYESLTKATKTDLQSLAKALD